MPAERVNLPAAVAGCIEACERCAAIAAAVDPHGFRDAPAGRSSIGAHLRHALEHVECLLQGMSAGLVDYDARPRDPELETDPDAMRAAVQRVCASLSGIDGARLDERLTVRESVTSGRDPERSTSTVARELTFVSGHTIHHVEIAGLVAAIQGTDLPPDLGLAFSTAAWQARRAQ